MGIWIRTAAAMLASSVLSQTADAAAVKYFSRQKLVSVAGPAYSYVPVYGAYGACSGGVQSAPVTGCTRSDGKSVDAGMCSAAPQTQPCTVNVTCAVLKPYYYSNGGTLASIGTVIGTVTDEVSQATAMCQSYGSSKAVSGICMVNVVTAASGGYAGFTVYYASGGLLASGGYATVYGQRCTVQ